MRSFLTLIPTIAMTALLLPGCAGAPAPQEKETSPTGATEELSSWSRIVEAAFEGDSVKRTVRGFIEHRRLKDHEEGHYFVYGIKDLKNPVGFYLPSGQTYRYKIEDDGKAVSRNIGVHRPAASARQLLGIKADIEFDRRISK